MIVMQPLLSAQVSSGTTIDLGMVDIIHFLQYLQEKESQKLWDV